MKKIIISLFVMLLLFSLSGMANIGFPNTHDPAIQWSDNLHDTLLVSHTINGTLKNVTIEGTDEKVIILNGTTNIVNIGDVTVPTEKLSVRGNISATGNIYSNGFVVQQEATSFQIANGTVLFKILYDNEANTRWTFTNDSLAFDTRLVTKTTSDLAEGTNLYFTNSRFDTDFSGKSTSDLSEGGNLYYTNMRADARFNALFVNSFDSNFSAKSTTNLAEGTNLYFTNIRADTRFDTKFKTAFDSNLSLSTINTNQIVGLGSFGLLNEIPANNVTTDKIADLAVTNAKINDLLYSKLTGVPAPVTNDTIQLNSQEQVTGLQSTDSPKFVALNVTNVRILTGASNPQNSVTAPTGSIYLRTNGTLYVKESGSGNTGWVSK